MTRDVFYRQEELRWCVLYSQSGYDWWAYVEEKPSAEDLAELDKIAVQKFKDKA